MPIQLRDYRDQLIAHDEFYSELHGRLLEEDLGEFYRRSCTDIIAPSADVKFNVAYVQVRRANSLWLIGRWEEAAAAISLAIAAFDDKGPRNSDAGDRRRA